MPAAAFTRQERQRQLEGATHASASGSSSSKHAQRRRLQEARPGRNPAQDAQTVQRSLEEAAELEREFERELSASPASLPRLASLHPEGSSSAADSESSSQPLSRVWSTTDAQPAEQMDPESPAAATSAAISHASPAHNAHKLQLGFVEIPLQTIRTSLLPPLPNANDPIALARLAHLLLLVGIVITAITAIMIVVLQSSSSSWVAAALARCTAHFGMVAKSPSKKPSALIARCHPKPKSSHRSPPPSPIMPLCQPTSTFCNQRSEVEFMECEQMITWASDIAAGMRYLHHEAPVRIIHRDLKSLNVLVTDDYTLKICDFGSSRQVSRDTKSVTSAGTVSWIMWLVAKHGMRLHIPDSAPQRYAQLIRSCLAQDPDKRPAFTTIVKELESMRHDGRNYQPPPLAHPFAGQALKQPTCLHQRSSRSKPPSLCINVNYGLMNWTRSPLRSPFVHHVPALQWSVDDVANWISVLPDGLSRYKPVFEENHIDGRMLLNLTSDMLKTELDIKSFGHRRALLEQIQSIQLSTVVVKLSLIYEHDLRRESWQCVIAHELGTANFIHQICHTPPFKYRGVTNPQADAQLLLHIYFKANLFGRKSVKRRLNINGNPLRDTIVVRLTPRPGAYPEVMRLLGANYSGLSPFTPSQSGPEGGFDFARQISIGSQAHSDTSVESVPLTDGELRAATAAAVQIGLIGPGNGSHKPQLQTGPSSPGAHHGTPGRGVQQQQQQQQQAQAPTRPDRADSITSTSSGGGSASHPSNNNSGSNGSGLASGITVSPTTAATGSSTSTNITPSGHTTRKSHRRKRVPLDLHQTSHPSFVQRNVNNAWQTGINPLTRLPSGLPRGTAVVQHQRDSAPGIVNRAQHRPSSEELEGWSLSAGGHATLTPSRSTHLAGMDYSVSRLSQSPFNKLDANKGRGRAPASDKTKVKGQARSLRHQQEAALEDRIKMTGVQEVVVAAQETASSVDSGSGDEHTPVEEAPLSATQQQLGLLAQGLRAAVAQSLVLADGAANQREHALDALMARLYDEATIEDLANALAQGRAAFQPQWTDLVAPLVMHFDAAAVSLLLRLLHDGYVQQLPLLTAYLRTPQRLATTPARCLIETVQPAPLMTAMTQQAHDEAKARVLEAEAAALRAAHAREAELARKREQRESIANFIEAADLDDAAAVDSIVAHTLEKLNVRRLISAASVADAPPS
ncbi:uncharacterized protein MONBRDRAFT_11590 [Monosiga brevicollis MX1]|uniref:Uncharacterized protein n=1 Tax=Monosiga brevicollis TaxID=81824 RepID=A9V9Q1_MONBE|nr:uncharacterized protein MONBRDRAFT_11590 [Monosiga brevicollis MX1]EDQ85761.1 predicted protein [Monosiga brevicollis MX1]|eukprot:XP_001749476.1 hypothetical protein [Monosiga brevicollis MX1]